jgi:hypothetical protein
VAKHVGGQFKNVLKGILNKWWIAAKVMLCLLSEEEEKKLSTHARIFQTGFKETHSFFQILSSQMMKLWFTV